MFKVNPVKNLDPIIESLEKHKEPIGDAWVVKYEGVTLVMNSGKSVWKKQNHASAAFTNHLGITHGWKYIRDYGFKNAKELAKYLKEMGIVKIEKLSQ